LSTVLSIFFLMICGLSLFAFYENRSGQSPQVYQQTISGHADRIMPQFISQELPHGISGLIIAGLLAAAMSGLSSGMNATASVLIGDLAPRLHRFRILRKPLVLERLVGICLGAMGIALAVLITVSMRRNDWNLVELSGRVNHLFIGPLAVLFFSGILIKRAVGEAVLAGFVVSVIVSALISYSKQLFGLEQSISFMWVIPCSCVIGVVISGLTSFLFRARGPVSVNS
jgi:SSS family solute:Na+ symporter